LNGAYVLYVSAYDISLLDKNMSALKKNTDTLLKLFFFILSGVRWSPLGTAATVGLFYQPQIIDDGDCGMKIGGENHSTQRKLAPVPLCPPQITHDLTWTRTRAAAVGSQRLTT
jgi:hypothetical protein